MQVALNRRTVLESVVEAERLPTLVHRPDPISKDLSEIDGLGQPS